MPYHNVNFGAGLIYFIYGEQDQHCAYKIGMTRKSPEQRIRESNGWGRTNLCVIHTIQADNMRVIELMFHMRFKPFVVREHISTNEWFMIDTKIKAISKCKAMFVNEALQMSAGEYDTYFWWAAFSSKQRFELAAHLWSHPLLRFEWYPEEEERPSAG